MKKFFLNPRRGIMAAALCFFLLAFCPAPPLHAGAVVGPLLDIDVGTADLVWSDVFTTHDSVNNRFLVVASEWGPDYINYYGRILNADGSHYSGQIPICTGPASQHLAAQPAFDPVNQRYLAVWADNRAGFWQSYGRFLNADGSPAGEEFRISPEDEWRGPGSLLYDRAGHRFLLIICGGVVSGWGPFNLFGQFINADSGLVGPAFQITHFTEGYGAGTSAAAYDSNNQRFLVAYGAEYDINETRAQVLNADGSSLSGEFRLAPEVHRLCAIAFDPINSRYLVLWDPSTTIRSHGQLVTAAGALWGDQFMVTDGYSEGNFGAVFDSRRRQFLVTGVAYNATPTFDGTFAQVLGLNGSRVGRSVAVDSSQATSTSTAYSPAADVTLAIWLGERNDGNNVFGRLLQANLGESVPPILSLLLED